MKLGREENEDRLRWARENREFWLVVVSSLVGTAIAAGAAMVVYYAFKSSLIS